MTSHKSSRCDVRVVVAHSIAWVCVGASLITFIIFTVLFSTDGTKGKIQVSVGSDGYAAYEFALPTQNWTQCTPPANDNREFHVGIFDGWLINDHVCAFTQPFYDSVHMKSAREITGIIFISILSLSVVVLSIIHYIQIKFWDRKTDETPMDVAVVVVTPSVGYEKL